MQIYDFPVKANDGREITLEEYKGKVLLIVNTASECGFTHQLEDLETLYQKYKGKGFYVLAFPCNQFAGQEPNSDEKIKEICSKNYGVTFPLFAKIDVNGATALELFRHLASLHKFEGFNLNHPLGKKLDEILAAQNPNYGLDSDIKWNFTKFLVDRQGTCVKRFEPTTDIDEIEDALAPLL